MPSPKFVGSLYRTRSRIKFRPFIRAPGVSQDLPRARRAKKRAGKRPALVPSKRTLSPIPVGVPVLVDIMSIDSDTTVQAIGEDVVGPQRHKHVVVVRIGGNRVRGCRGNDERNARHALPAVSKGTLQPIIRS